MELQYTIPAIYERRPVAARLGYTGRIWAAAIALGCFAIMVAASLVTPSRTGVGTHTELGMYRCEFLARFGVPCFSCGMTTSFAHFFRGNLLASFWVQPMGAVLSLICCISLWGGAYSAITGRSLARLTRRLPLARSVISLLVFAIAAWGWKMFIHARGIDGW